MELTNDHLKWVKRYISTVRSPSTPNLDTEDLAQEGWIAMWVALEKAKASGRQINEAYLKQAARWAILNLIKKRYPDLPIEPSEVPDAVTFQPDRDMSRHQKEIYEAVAELPQKQREYVYLRFWRDYSTKHQLSPAGYSTTLWYHPTNGAKARLQARLGHLANA